MASRRSSGAGDEPNADVAARIARRGPRAEASPSDAPLDGGADSVDVVARGEQPPASAAAKPGAGHASRSGTFPGRRARPSGPQRLLAATRGCLRRRAGHGGAGDGGGGWGVPVHEAGQRGGPPLLAAGRGRVVLVGETGSAHELPRGRRVNLAPGPAAPLRKTTRGGAEGRPSWRVRVWPGWRRS